jgi:hypothetical protein
VVTKTVVAMLLGICISLYTYADSPMLVDGAGRAMGYALGGGGCIISRTNYYTCIDTNGRIVNAFGLPSGGGVQGDSFFLTPDCTGATYTQLMNATSGSGGFVLETKVGLSYSPVGTTAQLQLGIQSSEILSDPTNYCYAPTTSDGSTTFFAMSSNDTAVTGLSSVPYASPLSIRVLPDSALNDEIFFDGFEVGY